jgi:hypothetical protein
MNSAKITDAADKAFDPFPDDSAAALEVRRRLKLSGVCILRLTQEYSKIVSFEIGCSS